MLINTFFILTFLSVHSPEADNLIAQVKGISEGVKANSEAGVSPSVNALATGVKAAAAIGGLADGLSAIGAQHADGQLAASQDNRLAQVFQHEAER